MIETFYHADTLGTQAAFAAALCIGFAFGFVLERAGFGSSRRLAGVFYFRDMAVLKVMFTGLTVAMLGLLLCIAMGWVALDRIHLLPTVFGAQAIGGLLFGLGFVMAGWCPGTAAVGLASGKIDALVFLIGALGGSILYNEVYVYLQPVYSWGESGTRFIWQDIGLAPAVFAAIMTAIAVACFWFAEYAELLAGGPAKYLRSQFLWAFSIFLLFIAGAVLIANPDVLRASASAQVDPADIEAVTTQTVEPSPTEDPTPLLTAVASGQDHIGPVELANRLMAVEQGLLVIDVRTPEEFAAFHLRSAVNVGIEVLATYLEPTRNQGTVVLYSNGMTHPAQARDALVRAGFTNVYLLTDGLDGFTRECLKPASLRMETVPAETAAQVKAWRAWFLGAPETPAAPAPAPAPAPEVAPEAVPAPEPALPLQ